LSANVTALGDSGSTDVWFVYWEKGNRATTEETTSPTSVSSPGVYDQTVDGLKSDTTYVFHASTYNGEVHDTGSESEFSTNAPLNVTTKSASSIGTDSATLNGELNGLGDSSSTDVWFVYWEKGARSSTEETTATMTKSSAGSFQDSVSGLQSNTSYVYHSATFNGETYTTGSDKEFTTS
jgi:subtilisin